MEDSNRNLSIVDSNTMELGAKFLVTEYYNNHQKHNESDCKTIDISDVFVVWFCKTIQNFKMLLGTDDPNDKMYYEVTYNGDKDELYLDVYKQVEHQVRRQNEMIYSDKVSFGII